MAPKVGEAADEGIITPQSADGESATQLDSSSLKLDSKILKTKSRSKPDSKHRKQCKKGKKAKEVESSSEEDSDDSEDESEEENSDADSSDETSSGSETETEKDRKKRKMKEKKKAKALDKKRKLKGRSRRAARDVSSTKRSSSARLTKNQESSSSESEASAEESSEPEDDETPEDDEVAEVEDEDTLNQHLALLQQLSLQMYQPPPQQTLHYNSSQALGQVNPFAAQIAETSRKITQLKIAKKTETRRSRGRRSRKTKEKKGKKEKSERATKLDYKRVNELWDSSIHNYKLTDTAEEEEESEYDKYLFRVRRTFDWEGKYKNTFIDIMSKHLKEALSEIMENVKGVSLAEETPAIDPNFLFLYLEELRDSHKALKTKLKTEKMKKKLKKRNETKVKHIKVLLKYLDKDYADTKKTLYPMLEAGLITFDLLWALYKPNSLAYTTTYGTADEPRAFKIEYAEKEYSFMRGESYNVEGRYLEYDGKVWGMGSMECDVPQFKGARKITSLACYPLKYHKTETKIRQLLIERGKKFVSLHGVQYKSHEGLAYTKRKGKAIKVNINGRIMVDPAIHRRINPNYQVSTVKPQDQDEEDASDDESNCCGSDSDEGGSGEKGEDFVKMRSTVVYDENKKAHVIRVPVDSDGKLVLPEKLDEIDKEGETSVSQEEKDKKVIPVFTDDEYLIASPVVLGFAFAEKLWLEFTVSGIKDITWNDGAYESLVLENNTKEIVKALVESHKYHPAESIDDVIQGKGKGLVAVLHGPPGTGKTLTAEGISELLKCPLYMVSAGELGTDPRTLEVELQKILDIAHAWGAVLLLDEADVFLEKRTIQDIHRNALVSIFLRLLEYFQGILFLTTNRVETFDDAFQSRIHIALRYGDLSLAAKKKVFKAFVELVRLKEGFETMPFKESDYDALAKHNLNGRQIKNTVRTAQALAVNKGEKLGVAHVRKVLDVLISFERDLKGGDGYVDAMRQYC